MTHSRTIGGIRLLTDRKFNVKTYSMERAQAVAAIYYGKAVLIGVSWCVQIP